ncbi:AT-hook motif nuclear-localized protein 8-like [Durio zibethinus]|uniref:AT-hook motif nuclear-localized protein n=1 Tax=Durio zibethinus TaxID=66656 RepID=A0A6P5YTY5_DURZI|nr:AT-hook motif nuclear-localized protein 8-like [Durio zibethinus]
MEEGESKLPAPFGMDEDQRNKENDRLITRKRKRKGTPSGFVLCNEDFSISQSFHQRPTEYFSNQEALDINVTEGNFLPCSMIANAGEDIIAKITSFCESCSCHAYIVSAVGSVAHASILHSGNASTYEGSYGIVTLAGHVSASLASGGSNGNKVVITLTGKNDSLFGGYVSGPLVAATNVQIMFWKLTHSPSEETSAQGSSSTVDSPGTEMKIP